MALSPYQQQSINYFYEYSLDNRLSKPKDWKQYNKEELIEMVNGGINNPINQIIVQKVAGLEDPIDFNLLMQQNGRK